MSDRVAKLPLGSLKVRENNFCYLNHLFEALDNCTFFIQRCFIATYTGNWSIHSSIRESGRQLNSTASFALEFLRQTIKYAIPGRAIFHDVFVFVVVPVIHDIKNWIPEIRRIGSSNKYLVLQINCASLWSFFNHTALQDTAWNFPLTFKRKVVECCWMYKCKLILKSINVWNKLDTGKSKTWN